MSKPGKVLRTLCKRLGVRLTVKRGKKRVYKSVTVLKRQCANKKKKKKKVKRKRRRKFGSVKKLQMIAAEAVVDDLFKQLDDENSETFRKSYSDLYSMMKKGNYPDFTLNMLERKFLAKLQTIIKRENFEKYYNAYKKYMTEKAVNLLKNGYTVLYTRMLVKSIHKLDFMKMHKLTADEYDELIKGQEIDVKQLRDQLEEEERERAHQASLAEIKAHHAEGLAAHSARLAAIEAARDASGWESSLTRRVRRAVERQTRQDRQASRQASRQEESRSSRQQRARDLESDSNSSFDWNIYPHHIGLGLGLAGVGSLGYLTHKFIKDQKKKRKFGKKKKVKKKRKRKK